MLQMAETVSDLVCHDAGFMQSGLSIEKQDVTIFEVSEHFLGGSSQYHVFAGGEKLLSNGCPLSPAGGVQ